MTVEEQKIIVEVIEKEECFFDGNDFYLPERLEPVRMPYKKVLMFFHHRVYFHPLIEVGGSVCE